MGSIAKARPTVNTQPQISGYDFRVVSMLQMWAVRISAQAEKMIFLGKLGLGPFWN